MQAFRSRPARAGCFDGQPRPLKAAQVTRFSSRLPKRLCYGRLGSGLTRLHPSLGLRVHHSKMCATSVDNCFNSVSIAGNCRRSTLIAPTWECSHEFWLLAHEALKAIVCECTNGQKVRHAKMATNPWLQRPLAQSSPRQRIRPVATSAKHPHGTGHSATWYASISVLVERWNNTQGVCHAGKRHWVHWTKTHADVPSLSVAV